MPTFDPSTIDPTKPTTGTALTADVRANEDATQTNLEGAFNDVAALEASAPTTDQKAALDAANAPSGANPLATIADADQAGHVIQSDGVPVANPRPNLNFAGNGVTVQDNAGNDSTDVVIDNANIANQGGGAEVWRDTTGADPITVNLRTIVAGTGAIVTQFADTIEIQATGAGGGEANRLENIGAGTELALAIPNGVNLQVRTLDTGQFELNGDQVRVQAGVYADDTTALAHYGNTGIHYPVSSLPGAGIVQNGTTLDVGAGDGITVNANDLAVDSTVARRNAANTFAGNVDTSTGGTLSELGVRVYSPNNPPPGGGVENPLTADLYSSTFNYTVGTVGAPLGYLGDIGGVALELVGSDDGGASSNIDLTLRGSSVTANGAFGVTFEASAGTVAMIGGAGVVTGNAAPQGQNTFNTDGSLYEAGVRVYSPNNPPPGAGGGIGAGTPFVVGDLMAVESDAGDGTAESVGFAAAAVARRDTANIFSEDQEIFVTSTAARQIIRSGDSAATFRLLPGNGTPDQRSFQYAATDGNLIIYAIDDAGTTFDAFLTMSHAGGAAFGNPTGGVPAAGAMNVEALLINNVPVTAGGGGGIGAGTPFVVGDLMAVESDAGDGTAETVGFAAADVARLDVTNIYRGNQILQPLTGTAQWTMFSFDDSCEIAFVPGDGVANERAFEFVASAGSLNLISVLDSGTPIGGPTISIAHDGGMAVGAPTGGTPATVGTLNAEALQVNGTSTLLPDVSSTIGEVGYPATYTGLSGATAAPTMAGNGYYYQTQTGALTVTTDADAVDGQWTLVLPATVTSVTLSPAVGLEVATDAPSTLRTLTLQRVNGNAIAYWGTA